MNTPPTHRRRWATLVVLSISLLVISLDNTVLYVVLPSLQRDLGATSAELQWIIDGYTLAFAGLLLTGGSWGDRHGRKRALNLGLLLFGAASLWGAFAGSAGELIAARVLMGTGAALVMPSTLSILTNTFTDPVERKKAIGVWAAVSGIGIAVGPALGGWLLEHYWWGSAFLLNVPVVTLGLALGPWLVPESRDPEAHRLDLVGAVLSVVGLVSLVWAIIEAPDQGWGDLEILGGMGIGIAVLGLFVLWELRTPHPMLNVRFFENRRFSTPAVAITLVFFALFGSAFFLSLYLQTVLGYDALAAGLRIVPLAFGLVLGAPLAMTAAQRIGEKIPTVVGLLLLSASFWLLSGTTVDSDYVGRIAVSVVLLGFGMGLAMAPATEAVMGSLPRAQAGVGSAVNDTVRQVGGTLGVAVLGSILNSVYAREMADAVAGLPPSAASTAEDSLQGAYAVAEATPGAAGASLVTSAEEAFVVAMDVTVLVAAFVVLAGAVVALLWMPHHGTSPDDTDDERRDGGRDAGPPAAPEAGDAVGTAPAGPVGTP